MRLVLMLILSGLVATAACASPPWPTREWPLSAPEEQGLDGAALAKLDEDLGSGRHGYVDSMLVIRNGRIVHEATYRNDYDALFASVPDRTPGIYNYYDPEWHPYYKRGVLHTMQSVTKSVTSALVGIAIERGEIPGVEAQVLPYFEGYRLDDDARRGRMTLRHLLTMSAGIKWDEDTVPYTDPANSCAAMEASQDWVQFVLDQPMAAEPGSTFVYNSGVSELLSQILYRATGLHVDAYAEKYLFGPLGIADFYWKRTPTGHPDTEGGLYLAPRDLARLGYLYLRRGRWEGRRILPEGWVDASTSALIDTGPDERGFGYGYQWWVFRDTDAPAYAARGYGGQYLLVVPQLDLIAVFTGWNIYDRPPLDPRLALDRVLQAVRSR